jgi:hypothetical protein
VNAHDGRSVGESDKSAKKPVGEPPVRCDGIDWSKCYAQRIRQIVRIVASAG